jgi:hypothetical protein
MSVITRQEASEHCRCYACGSTEPMGCGELCADCSWEDHLVGMAHTGGSPADDPTHVKTPTCCRERRDARQAEWKRLSAELVPDGTYGGARKVEP